MMEFGTLEGILGCIHAGLGVSLLPRSVIERAMMKYNVYHHSISDELLRAPTVFIRRKDTLKPQLYPNSSGFREKGSTISNKQDVENADFLDLGGSVFVVTAAGNLLSV